MTAFILAGGLGTRLRPQFGELPKVLAPLRGTPFIVRQLEWLSTHGIRRVVLCVGYGADQVREVLGDGRAWNLELVWSEEPEPLGTGGALALARGHVRGPALILNGDTLPECHPWALERARWERGRLGAIALFEVEDARARGRVECDDAGRVLRFVEKDPDHRGPAWVNGGLYAFDPGLWHELPQGPGSFERDVLPRLAAAGALYGYHAPGTFYDIGTPEEWERAERGLPA